jgi:hypothetical protein
MPTPSDSAIVAAVQRWLERAVIGLNLCPFAKAVHAKRQIRYAVSRVTSPEAVLGALAQELRRLEAADPEAIDTTLLILPEALADFADYNDFLVLADHTVAALGLSGEIQVASFHPQYQFAGTAPDDIENYTNRAPYPILHLLREASIDRAVAAFPDAAEIFERNEATLRQLGLAGWQRLWERD